MANGEIPEAFVPRTIEEILSDLEDVIVGETTTGLSRFWPYSFETEYFRAYAMKVREHEIIALAVLLSNWIDYCTGVDESDMETLGLADEPITREEINRYLFSDNLDPIGKKLGVERRTGTRATGHVTFEVASETARVYEGTRVTTDPVTSDVLYEYYVDLDGDGSIDEGNYTTPDSGREVTVPIVAEEIGGQYDIGPGQAIHLPDPPQDVVSARNDQEITGGADRESDDSFRSRIKGSIHKRTYGGNKQGMKDGIRTRVDGVEDVEIIEYTDQHPVYSDVIVDGGERDKLLSVINEVRPVALDQRLIRPERINISVRAEIAGTGITEDYIVSEIERYLTNIEIGENLYEDDLVQLIENLEDDIRNIETLSLAIESVESERHTYDSDTGIYSLDVNAPTLPFERYVFRGTGEVYEFEVLPIKPSTVEITSTTYQGTTTFTEGTDYRLVDSTRDEEPDLIEWIDGGDSPDMYETFTAEYEYIDRVGEGLAIEDASQYFADQDVYNLRFEARDSSFYRITDSDGHAYDRGVAWEAQDRTQTGDIDSIRWLPEGNRPNDGATFYPHYDIASGTLGAYEVYASVDNEEGTKLEESVAWETFYGGDNYFDLEIHWRNATESGAKNPSEGWKDQSPVYPDDGTEFTVNYDVNQPLNEDYIASPTQKISPGQYIEVEAYDIKSQE
jgi:hypothetical protein